jgi:hypothetical protein
MLVPNVSPENRGEVFTSSDVNYNGVATEVENGSHWVVRLLHAPAPPRRTGLVPQKTVSFCFSTETPSRSYDYPRRVTRMSRLFRDGTGLSAGVSATLTKWYLPTAACGGLGSLMIADPEGPSFLVRTVERRRYADDASMTHDPKRTWPPHSTAPCCRDVRLVNHGCYDHPIEHLG